MNIPGLGEMTRDSFGEPVSSPVSVPMLNGAKCQFIVEGYDEDGSKEEFHFAIATFLSDNNAALSRAAPHIFTYYEQIKAICAGPEDDFVEIEDPTHIWSHIQLGHSPVVSRRAYGDERVYVSLECNCDWEPEHGLQIVFREGAEVTKIGPYDGHLANSDAYADESLEGVVYYKWT